ncbi:NAD-dependent epimerase/dehydratase family protein [Caenimonas koreensis]|uniref:NAD-dependent epimerase/dehydratase family protein n=1 Tax=Caenimonas koreensis TaxID=367474 RepID=UPI003782DF47
MKHFNRPVLVCGASGFVGGAALRALTEAGVDSVGTSRTHPEAQDLAHASVVCGDLGSRNFAQELFLQTSPGTVIFASGPADVQTSIADPVSDYMAQLQPLLHVLWAASRQPQPPKVLLVSSAAVYGNPVAVPVREECAPHPISPYGFHKLAQEHLLAEFHSLYRIPISIARVFSVLGPGLRRLAVWDITTRALKGDRSLRGTGQESRDYLSGRDLGTALTCIARNAAFDGEVFNVASGTETAIRDLAAMILCALGVDEPAVFDNQCLVGSPVRWRADTTQLRALGFQPETTLAAAVQETVEWIRRHA